MSGEWLIAVVIIVLLFFGTLMALLGRYKRCPSDKILVIYGMVGGGGKGHSAKCIHGGASFIWPVLQAYSFLDLTPMSIEVMLTNALSRQNIRIDVPSRFTVGISTEEGVMQNAAERLLGRNLAQIQELAKDIIFGQLRLVVATMDIEEINTDRDKFLAAVSNNVETELKKIGLRLINVNITDINDESGYIQALGKEASSKAINDARKSVAERNRDGAIGEANAHREERIQVATADSQAITGENEAKITIANSNATLREQQADANRRALAADKVQQARALEEAYKAERDAELGRFARERASQEADIIVKVEINKRQIEIQAEADAERVRRIARGEADAIFATMEARARGLNEILTKQAQGFQKLVEAAGGDSDAAIRLLIADKLEDIVKVQVEAIKNLTIDKITVWDSMKDGTPTSANFLSGMLKSIPPLGDMFDMAGMQLPKYLGETKEAAELEKKQTEV